MKKLTALLFLLASFSGVAQIFSSDITNDDYPLTWLGLDFSEARFIKSFTHPLDVDAFTKAYQKWNAEVVSNRKRFPLEESFHRKVITRNTTMIDGINRGIDVPAKVTEDLYLLYKDNLRRAVERYNLSGIEPGVALSFVVEAIDVERREFSGYMLAIDVAQNRLVKTYYLKARFSYDLEPELLILPFRNILKEFSETLEEKDDQ